MILSHICANGPVARAPLANDLNIILVPTLWLKISLCKVRSARSMAAAAHSWEDRRTNWDDVDLNLGECTDTDDEVDREITDGTEFVRYMLSLMFASTISATIFCIVMWYAGRAGIKEATSYGLKPGSHSSNYSRKVKTLLGWRDRTIFYEADVPGHGKHDLERSVQIVNVIPAHEQAASDRTIHEDDQVLRDLRAKDGGLPPSYWHHPVVQGEGPDEITHPVAIYIDGVPYSHTDGVIGFWVHLLITGRRYLIAVLRKRIICNCGCRGWCTLWHFLELLRWDLECFALGRRSTARHDLKPWKLSDRERVRMAGEALPIKAACLYIKGDWMEYASTMGFPMWNDNLRPCFDCNAYVEILYNVTGVTMEALEWRINEEDDYFDACDRCEIIVRILRHEDQQRIEAYLRYDKREHGFRGRALTRDILINGSQLRANDRLEPSRTLADVGHLHLIDVYPTPIVFWRSENETLTRHRNPIFDRAIGVTPHRSLTVDLLHCLFLGIMNVWARTAIWHLIMSGAFGDLGTKAENIRAAVLVMRSGLMKWYVEHASTTSDDLTRVSDLTVNMLGSPSDQKLKTKGAETWGVCLFAIDELRKRSRMVGSDGERLMMAGEMLEQCVRTWKAHQWTIPQAEIKGQFAKMQIHMDLMRPFECFVPKHHLIFHAICGTEESGNPWKYSTWMDESLNKTLKGCCKHASQITFETTILMKMNEVLKELFSKRSRKRDRGSD
jgi:hypothetical protein